jgi:peroxiredoxin
LRDFIDPIRAHGAELVYVGNGSVEDARRFAEEQVLGCPLLTDPTVESYRAAGLRSGLRSGLSPGVLLRAARALRAGFRQGETLGPTMQQGGAFVIDRGGGELYAHVSHQAGDHPAPEDLLAALTQAHH